MQAGLPVLTKKTQKFLALHHRDVCVIQQFGRHFMVGAGQCCAQAKHFTGSGHVKREALSRLRADRQFGTSFTQNENSARRLPFAEQDSVPRTSNLGFHSIKRGQHVSRQVAKNPIRAQGTLKAILLYRALHSW